MAKHCLYMQKHEWQSFAANQSGLVHWNTSRDLIRDDGGLYSASVTGCLIPDDGEGYYLINFCTQLGFGAPFTSDDKMEVKLVHANSAGNYYRILSSDCMRISSDNSGPWAANVFALVKLSPGDTVYPTIWHSTTGATGCIGEGNYPGGANFFSTTLPITHFLVRKIAQ